MNYYQKYIKYKSKYISLKKNIEQNGGEQFYINFSGKGTKRFDSVDDKIFNTDELVEAIRNKFMLPETLDFIIKTKSPIISNIRDTKAITFNEGSTIQAIPLQKKITDTIGTIVLSKLFKYLKDNLHPSTQIIVVPFSSNTEIDNIPKNIMQQFQYTNIEDDVNNLIYVLFDDAFFRNINKEFYDYINFVEIPVEFITDETEKIQIRKYVKPVVYNFNMDYPSSHEYVDKFEKLVSAKINRKDVTFYVVQIRIDNEEIYKKGCAELGDSCNLYNFEGAEYK